MAQSLSQLNIIGPKKKNHPNPQSIHHNEEKYNYYEQLTWIIKFTTVVRCRKDCHQLSLCEEFVSILNYLMRPANQIEIMLL